MAEKRNWHPRFLKYIQDIVTNENYKGLAINKKEDGTYSWIATAKSDIGKKRLAWCESKALELGLTKTLSSYPGMYADVMLEIHPTKWKVCQICGKEMSIYYHYPNVNFAKKINKKFGTDFNCCDHISDIWDDLINLGNTYNEISDFFVKSGNLTFKNTPTKEDIIESLEYSCRKGNKKCLGPGAMSNFPDRFDGFHTYNRCCRATEDKGRSKDNLKSYTKDRRAYEYWSDGNIHAANQFMGSKFFEGTSADHIGPISLGFVHDPRYLQPMLGGANSAKRDRLYYDDVVKIIETEVRTGVYPMSWYSKEIWEFIKSNFEANPKKVPTSYRDALKQNFTNFMFVLHTIITECPIIGEEFLVTSFLQPNHHYFEKSYTFNQLGEIVDSKPRHFTKRNEDEFSRYRRIAIEAVMDFSEKSNRNSKFDLTNKELLDLKSLVQMVSQEKNIEEIKLSLISLMIEIQKRIISLL